MSFILHDYLLAKDHTHFGRVLHGINGTLIELQGSALSVLTRLRSVVEYCRISLPVAVHFWLSYPNDFRKSVIAVIECGDADTTAAIVSGIGGARVGKEGIPAEWIGSIWEWQERFMDAISWNRIVTDLAKYFACTEGEPDRCYAA